MITYYCMRWKKQVIARPLYHSGLGLALAGTAKNHFCYRREGTRAVKNPTHMGVSDDANKAVESYRRSEVTGTPSPRAMTESK